MQSATVGGISGGGRTSFVLILGYICFRNFSDRLFALSTSGVGRGFGSFVGFLINIFSHFLYLFGSSMSVRRWGRVLKLYAQFRNDPCVRLLRFKNFGCVKFQSLVNLEATHIERHFSRQFFRDLTVYNTVSDPEGGESGFLFSSHL